MEENRNLEAENNDLSELDSDGVRALSAAVILQAYKDLVWSYRVLKRGEKKSSQIIFARAVRFKKECEKFFREDNYILGNYDGLIAIEKARKEADFKEDE